MADVIFWNCRIILFEKLLQRSGSLEALGLNSRHCGDQMVVDMKRNKSDVSACMIKGQEVERVTVYKYLGTLIDDKLTFDENSYVIYKKCRQRMHVLYTLRSLHVNNMILERCYQAFIQFWRDVTKLLFSQS